MWERLRETWLPRLCFLAALAVAGLLTLAIAVAPQLAVPDSPRLLTLFAEDTAVRRTALACSLGLVVTAFVFFRPSGPRPKRPAPKEPPGTMAGA